VTGVFDSTLLATFAAWRSPPADAFFLTLTWLGSLWVLLPLALVIAAAGALRGEPRLGPLVGLLAASLASHVLKRLFERERPQLFEALATLPDEPSFPSSHAAQATAFALLLAFLAPAPLRPLALALATAGAVGVGVSRAWLQVHWPSDVVAGWLLGGLVALAVMHFLPERAA